jgi:hypothetical protein
MKRVIVLALIAATACNSRPKLDRAATVKLLTGSERGLIAGIDIGDQIADVKAHLPEGLQFERDWVHDGFTTVQLDRPGGVPIHDDLLINLDIGKGTTVDGIEAMIFAEGENRVVLRDVLDEVLHAYNGKLGYFRDFDDKHTDFIFPDHGKPVLELWVYKVNDRTEQLIIRGGNALR